MRLSTRLKKSGTVIVIISLLAFLGTVAWARTGITRAAVFEARVASTSAKLHWIKKEAPGDGVVYIAPQAFLNNRDLAGATARTDALGRPLLVMTFKTASAVKLMAATARQESRHVAILINNEIVAILPVKGPMTGNRLAVEGFSSEEEAKHIAGVLTAIAKQ